MNEKQGTRIEAEGLLLLVSDAIERGAYLEALTLVYGIIHQFPTWGPAYNVKGWLYANVFNNLEEAAEGYREALALSPDHLPTYLNYAVLLNKVEAFDALTALLEKGLCLQGIDKAQVYHEFGIMYEKQGRYEEAAQAYREAIPHVLKAEEVAYFNEAIHRCALKQEIVAGPSRSEGRPFFNLDARFEKRMASSDKPSSVASS